MGVHSNVHIPGESWPNWIWYAIEFAIVLAISMLVARAITDSLVETVALSLGHGDALDSFAGLTIYSAKFQSLPDEIESQIVGFLNWIFYGVVAAIFLGWYIGIRSLILKKIILGNKYY